MKTGPKLLAVNTDVTDLFIVCMVTQKAECARNIIAMQKDW